MNAALTVAFRGGAVTGLLLIGLGLLAYYPLLYGASQIAGQEKAIHALLSLGFGGSFDFGVCACGRRYLYEGGGRRRRPRGESRSGDSGRRPRNPAVIADNVGDNVGDCAGMAADLFETYAVTTVAAMVLPSRCSRSQRADSVSLALGASRSSRRSSGIFFVKVSPGGEIMPALYKGLFVAVALRGGILPRDEHGSWQVWARERGELLLASLIGLAVTLALVFITDYYTPRAMRR